MGTTLDRLPIGGLGVIRQLTMNEELKQRAAAFGLRLGGKVKLLRRAPFGGPLVVAIGGTELLLRRALARGIAVELAA
ncbi:ferrous iron transport protein A [Neisseriaceae bacterium JH1-16]|nr:ferrous iron transport protein A [Neisseriaceae bacterium JH1-16]